MKNAILANVMLAPCMVLLVLSDCLPCAFLLVVYMLCGWYVCKHSAKVRSVFSEYLQTVEEWEWKHLGGE